MSRLRKPKAGFWIRLCVMTLYPIGAVMFSRRWRHLDRVPPPEAGGVIIAMNHLHSVDTALMARLVWDSGRIPRFMIKGAVFGWPVIGTIMRGTKQIPVQRGTADAAQSLSAAVDALDRGEAVVIYPEGTTTKDPAGWPMQPKTGISRLILQRPDIPVVPVGQWGAQRGSFRGRRRVSLVSVGEPLDLSVYRDREPGQRVQREIADTVMSAIRDQVAELRGETPPDEFFKPTRTYVDKR